MEAIARNFLWTWQPPLRQVFERIDAARWESLGHNPVRMVQSLTPADCDRLAKDDDFLAALGYAASLQESYLAAEHNPPAGLEPGQVIAYFSLEFAITESLPIYSGGLGVLAGDHLKSASDLSLPLIAVGLYYREGYFQQVLAPDGWQQEEYSTVDPAQQPFALVLRENGDELRIGVTVAGRVVQVRVWEVHVGRVRLFLLDSNAPENAAEDRDITGRLYGGDAELRLKQEMLLGIGGVRVLRDLEFKVAVFHMNEGHSSLLGLERSRLLVREDGLSVAAARHAVAASTAFTTHTPVAAGIDEFTPDMLGRNLGPEFAEAGLDTGTILSFGRMNPADQSEPLSMAVLGLRLSGFRNGVSRLHGEVSRRLWNGAWAGVPEEQIPIGSVTNGVHLPTWVAPEMADLFDRHLGDAWRRNPSDPASWENLANIPPEETWAIRNAKRQQFVERVRHAKREDALSRGLPANDSPLDAGILTIGFARRFAAYKRATLLFRDPDRLSRILNHAEYPMQIVFAGKAHPRDQQAKDLIRAVVTESRRPEFAGRVVLLEHYDVDLARTFVQGSDIWLNTPTRPLEASGTSGMKAVANGSLHASVLDGWWAEAFMPGLGWAIGAGDKIESPEAQAARDAESLYQLLESEVPRLFYDHREHGVPTEWVHRVHGSIAAYAPRFNTNRMVQDYAVSAYGPAARAGLRLAADNYAAARALAEWLENARRHWGEVKILAVDDEPVTGNSAAMNVTVQIHPGSLHGEDFQVDVCHGVSTLDGALSPTASTQLALVSRAEDGTCRYAATVSFAATSGRVGYAVRVLPSHPELAWPFDAGLVLWA